MAMTISSAAFVSALKAADPLFAAAMTRVLLGEQISIRTGLSLVIIVAGIIFTCETEWDLQLNGLATELVANVCFPLRSILMKKLTSENEKFDPQILFWYMSMYNCVLAFVGILFENYSIEGQDIFDVLTTPHIFGSLVLAALCHYLYNVFFRCTSFQKFLH